MSASPIATSALPHGLRASTTSRSGTTGSAPTREGGSEGGTQRFLQLLAENRQGQQQSAAATARRTADGTVGRTAVATAASLTTETAAAAARTRSTLALAAGERAAGRSGGAIAGVTAAPADVGRPDTPPDTVPGDSAVCRGPAGTAATASARPPQAAATAATRSGSTARTDTETDAAASPAPAARGTDGTADDASVTRPNRAATRAANRPRGDEPATGARQAADPRSAAALDPADDPAAAEGTTDTDTVAADDEATSGAPAVAASPTLEQALQMQALIGHALAGGSAPQTGAPATAAAQAESLMADVGDRIGAAAIARPGGRVRPDRASGTDGLPAMSDGSTSTALTTGERLTAGTASASAEQTSTAHGTTGTPADGIPRAPEPPLARAADAGLPAPAATGGPLGTDAATAGSGRDRRESQASAASSIGMADAGLQAMPTLAGSGAPVASGASSPFAQTLQAATAATASTPTDTGTASATLQAAVDSADFAPALGGQVLLWARDGVQQAQLNLNPAELGPVQVRIAIDGDQARVDFQAAHAETREALREAREILSQALQEAGLALSGSEVTAAAETRGTDTGAAPGEGERGAAQGSDARTSSQGQSQSRQGQPQTRTGESGSGGSTRGDADERGDARLARANAAAVPQDVRRSERLVDLLA